ncbi:unnamed protein product [Linum tenue]|uniref:Alcohol dehydrogenase-like N-terminal domain-containing protein n=1 Tax=Linum tenue TaxID=586396 RepID=A0AAV0KJ47_9ROSI|nr:unnamed protein product [Linum tenue]
MEEVMVAPQQAHEARIRIVCTSLCQSDITFWKMKDFLEIMPRILGHEAFGRPGRGDEAAIFPPPDSIGRSVRIHCGAKEKIYVKDRCGPRGDVRFSGGWASPGLRVAIPSMSILPDGYQQSSLRNGCREAGPCCVIEGRNGWRRNI